MFVARVIYLVLFQLVHYLNPVIPSTSYTSSINKHLLLINRGVAGLGNMGSGKAACMHSGISTGATLLRDGDMGLAADVHDNLCQASLLL